MVKKKFNILLLISLLGLLWSCNTSKQIVSKPEIHTIQHGNLQILIDGNMFTKIGNKKANTDLQTVFQPSEYITVRKKLVTEFKLSSFTHKSEKDSIGTKTYYTIIGNYINQAVKIEKTVHISCYDKMPDMAFFDVKYSNHGSESLMIKKWTNHDYQINKNPKDTTFWSFQGSSTADRADWILPVGDDFYQKNYMGMNNSDYGGGIPIVDVWRSDVGIAIGHTTMYPQLVSLPVEREFSSDKTSISIEKNYADGYDLEPNESLETLSTFVSTHEGDCYRSLDGFTKYMVAKGLKFAEPEPDAFEAIWCAWGYERGFTLDEIIGTLGKAKEIGFKWAVLDDGFQMGEGDWEVNATKFPGGSNQMKQFVDKIHSYDMKAKLWWAPLAVDPCTNLLHNDPDIILYTDEWAPRIITWWDAYYMGPTYEKTKIHTDKTIDMFIDQWGFDGLKMDGQHMNAVPPDHHPKHKLDYPEQACEQLPLFFKSVYERTRSKKKNAVVENCPCGCCMSFYNMPYINQSVSSDPLNSKQIRQKGKVYKAIMPHTAYYGDHVELSDNASDFASSFGVGAVLGSKFTWPKDNPTAEASYLLTPAKEIKWKHWIGLYNELMLSKEPYLGKLYDIGFDKPETHVIQKGTDMYYAFYDKNWNGSIEFRGLESGSKYKVVDYINNVELGEITGENPSLMTSFKESLLVRVSKI